MHSSDQKPSALGYALLIYMTLVIAAITLIPFKFGTPDHTRINMILGSVSDIVSNVVLFFPLGYLFQLTRRRTGWLSLLNVLGFGVLFSTVMEACQIFLPGRDSSLIDVAANGLGTLLGAGAAAYQRAIVRREHVSFLFDFEMPLMNVVYLLIPLLWFGSLSMGGEINRLGPILVLGVFGGCIIASVHVKRLLLGWNQSGYMPAVYAAGWFLIGAFPAVAAFPLQVLAVAVLIGGASQLSARLWKMGNKPERRFELPTLKKMFPLYGIYLLLVSVWPTTLPLGRWHDVNYRRFSTMQHIVFTSRFIEMIAAFTLLGFMVAGMRGRNNESALKTLSWAVGCALAFSIFTTALRNFISGPLSSVLETCCFTGAALYGAVIYRLQIEAVKRLKTST